MYFFYYIPLGINAKLERFPFMTAAYATLMTAVFVLARYFPDAGPFDFYNLVYIPQSPHWLTAAGSAFLHFGFFHLIGNIAYLVILGRYVEDRVGPIWFTLLFLSSAAVGNYAQGVFNTHLLDDPALGIIGASGAISGLLGAFSIRFIRSKLRIAYWTFMPLQAFTRAGTVEIASVFAIALWFLLQVVRGLVQTGGGNSNVAYVNHLSGFVWGAAFAIALGEYGRGRVEAMLRTGHDYVNKGQPYAAQGSFIRYLSHRPDDACVYASLARAMVLSGNRQGAIKNYRQACEMLLEQQHRGDAEDIFQEAVRGFELFALGPDRHLDLAFGLERNLKPELAATAYENFTRRYPRHAEAPFTLLRAAGLHMNTLTNLPYAHKTYKRLIEEYPDDQWTDFAREQVRCLGLQPGTG